jgi:hypothetical protein
MRNLNIEEFEDKIRSYALDVEYIDKQHLSIKLEQFLNFLDSQQISVRLLERIEEDFAEIKNNIPDDSVPKWHRAKQEFMDNLKTPEHQGAFGYFLISQTFKSKKKHDSEYLDITNHWYNCKGDYDQWREDFNNLIFKPFIELINWYISESQSYNSNEYFSKREIAEFSQKLDNLPYEVRSGQEIIYDEIQDIKEQLKNMKKKNWVEVLKGKLLDLTLSKVISLETFSIIVKAITGDDIKFLGN